MRMRVSHAVSLRVRIATVNDSSAARSSRPNDRAATRRRPIDDQKPNARLPDLGPQAIELPSWAMLEGHVGPEPAAGRTGAVAGATTSKSATALWNQHAAAPGASGDGRSAAARARRPPLRRPATGPSNPAAAYTAQMYLLNARTLMQMADAVEGDAKTKARIRFAVQQWIDAAGAEQLPGAQPRGAAAGARNPGREPRHRHAAPAGTTAARATCRRPTRACSRSAATWPPPKARWCSRTSCSS